MSAITILHLEDNDLDAETVRSWLVKGGFDPAVDRATGRAEFVAALEASPYDLILADYPRAGFDGMSALEVARERAPQAPFVFVAGGLGEEVAVEALKRGASDYVLKSGLGRLAAAVRRALAEAREQAERRRAEDALRESDRRKDEFLAMLAHELRNPLSAIHNAVQLMRRAGLPPERVEWTKDIIAHQVRHLVRLVDDLLDVSRVSRGKIRLQPEETDLAEVVRRAVESTRPQVEERRHELTASVGPGPFRLMADPTRVEQIVANLLSNAAKYTEPGGHVALTVGREGGEVVVRVKDDGIGMTAEMVGRVFDLFAQADTSLDRTKGGLGVGLTVARKLAELHGGSLAASSAGLGAGSEFQLRLPAVEPAAATPPEREGEPGAAAPARVLVVDDNVRAAWSLAELLRTLGHDVSLAHDGGEALEAARRDRPDVVLLDIGLPTLDGYQVARQLRREDGLSRALIIAVTGYGGEQAFRRSREAGFDHHMVKPVDYDRLLALLAGPPHARPHGGAARVGG